MNFLDLLPRHKRDDPRFMRLATAIHKAILSHRDDGGSFADAPMLCAVLVISFALETDHPEQLVEAVYRMMRTPVDGTGTLQ